MARTQRLAVLFVLICCVGATAAIYIVHQRGRQARQLNFEVVLPSGDGESAIAALSAKSSSADTGGAALGAGSIFEAPVPALVAMGQSAAFPTASETEPAAPGAQYADAGPPAGDAPAAGAQSAAAALAVSGGPGAIFNLPSAIPGGQRRGGLTILQIGDSHTAADFFTGEVRQLLQARFGDGGLGYLNAGKPHPGVRSAVVKVNASPGWTYSALQKTSDTDQFYLSGFNASVSGSGESLAFVASQPTPFDMIEVEAVFGPGRGGVSIAIDDLPPVVHALDGARTEKRVFRVTPAQGAPYDFHKMTITSTGSGQVTIASVGVFNHSYGVSYSAIGFPGASVDVINQINSRLFGEELRRLDPQLVVLAFGTNEGFNDNLDMTRYAERYGMVLKKIRENLPRARVILVAPPNANRLPGRCKGEGASASCKAKGGDEQGCFWSTPPALDKVRDLQRQIARQENFLFWNWGEITPGDCGAHALVNASPRRMAPDHVHFTGEGYKAGARAFAKFLIPVVEAMRLGGDAVSNR